MKYIHIFLIAVVFAGCSNFPTEFSNIRSQDARVIDFIYEPAEASPGDTVHVKAIFAGKEIHPSDINWNISYDVVMDKYGTDTAFNIHPLNVSPVESTFSDKTSCMTFSFVIPSDIMYQSGTINSDDIKRFAPDAYKSYSKSQLIHFVEDTLISNVKGLSGAVINSGNLPDSLKQAIQVIPSLCQIFSAKIRLFAGIKNEYTVRSDYSVRYNSWLKNTGLVYINNNPKIDSIGIYKVPGTVTKYDPSQNKAQFFRLDVPKGKENTILIDKNYSYFVRVFSDSRDTFQTLDGDKRVERLYSQWFYQLESSETKNISLNDFMHLDGDSTLIQLTVPNKKEIKTFTIWAQVYDNNTYNNVLNFPSGSAVIEGRGKFEYSE